jgi:hypothetical protein
MSNTYKDRAVEVLRASWQRPTRRGDAPTAHAGVAAAVAYVRANSACWQPPIKRFPISPNAAVTTTRARSRGSFGVWLVSHRVHTGRRYCGANVA